jgi:hypothetical protein
VGSGRDRAYYWGLHLDERSRQPTPSRPEWRPRFSVQQLAPEGGPTEDIAYFDDATRPVALAGHEVPAQVLAVIVTLPKGDGVYLSHEGVPTEAF